MDDILLIAARFQGGPSTTALLCPETLCGAPILCVSRRNNVWQFLCGKDHSHEHVYEEHADDPRMTTVQEVVARDPSVADVATMNDRHILRRRSLADSWVPDDDLSLWWI